VLLLRQALSPKSSCAGGSQFEADFPVSGGYSTIHLFLENMCASALAAVLLRNQHEIRRAGRKTPLSVLYAMATPTYEPAQGDGDNEKMERAVYGSRLFVAYRS
jgi:hypothetical protein